MHPVKGMHPLLSSHAIASLKFIRLEHSVRASQDSDLLRIQKIARVMPHEITLDIEEEFTRVFCRACTFINDFYDEQIPRNATYVFGKKEPGRIILSKLIANIKSKFEYLSVTAIDEQALPGCLYQEASIGVLRLLDSNVKEPRELLLYKGGVYQVTFNHGNIFSQAQLAILMDLPTALCTQKMEPFEIFVAPPGCKSAPPPECTKEYLLAEGWRAVMMRRCPSRIRQLRGKTCGRRLQYGLRMFSTSTIHAVMGQTCGAIVSKVDENESNYQLWEREQVVVLLSRTCLGKQMYFVDNSGGVKTVKSILSVLKRSSQFAHYISTLLRNLTLSPNQRMDLPEINFNNHPFRPRDISLPTGSNAYAYILVSTRNTAVTYIGETSNLTRRLQAHHRGTATPQTAIEELRPFCLLAFFCGTSFGIQKRKAFEAKWKTRRELLPAGTPAQVVADLAKTLVLDHKETFHANLLVYVQGGEVVLNGQ